MSAVEPPVEFATLEDNIACITLNRPERLNAIDGSLIDGVDRALDALGGGEFRAAILTGAGRGFCAGAALAAARVGAGRSKNPRRARRSRSTTTRKSAWPTCTPASTSSTFR